MTRKPKLALMLSSPDLLSGSNRPADHSPKPMAKRGNAFVPGKSQAGSKLPEHSNACSTGTAFSRRPNGPKPEKHRFFRAWELYSTSCSTSDYTRLGLPDHRTGHLSSENTSGVRKDVLAEIRPRQQHLRTFPLQVRQCLAGKSPNLPFH